MDEALYALLTGNAPITARVSGRIYLGLMPQGYALPALVLGLGGTLIGLNVLLAAFNLIPLGALDGAGIFRVLVPDRYVHRYDAFRYHPYAWIALVLLGLTGVLSLFLAPIQMGAYRLLLHPARLILGV